MSPEGPKMVGERYGLAGNGLKWPKNQEKPVSHGGRHCRFAGLIQARPAVVGLETSRPASFGCPPPPCLARVAGGRPVVPPLVQTPTARKWSNDSTWCSRFWRVFPRVLDLKRVFWG